VYQGYRYTIVTFINGADKPPSAQAELWWQRESDTPLARWTYFRRHGAATGAEAARQLEAGFQEWADGRLEAEGNRMNLSDVAVLAVPLHPHHARKHGTWSTNWTALTSSGSTFRCLPDHAFPSTEHATCVEGPWSAPRFDCSPWGRKMRREAPWASTGGSADGRRVFSTEFKRATVQRILTGEKTLAELSRELDISPSVIRNWKRFAEVGATTAVQASEDVVPASHLREAYAKIRELERALGRKTMEVEILRAAQEVVKKTPSWRRESGRGRPTP